MNSKFFEELKEKRRILADSFDDPAATGVWNSVIDKYSEQAHFIYELIQNADDTQATYARFKLYHDRLLFAHNGKRQFTISNPLTEKEDRKNGCLGDVNAILSIGHSSKTQHNTIGKFGVGFKAVFQYTQTPYIFAPDIMFKIERFIVPVTIIEDHIERKEDETLFEFPFNHEINNADIAFDAISQRLLSLVNPTLFLSNLQEIDFEFDDTKGYYRKIIDKTYDFANTKAELISLSQTIGEESKERKLWLFSRNDDSSGRYSVGFYLDDNGNLMPVNEYAYCFFPTKADTGLHFIIHAPFLLTDSREGIKEGEPHNQHMLDLLSDLSADSLSYLAEIGDKNKHRLIKDGILSIIPTESLNQTDWRGRVTQPSKFEPFYQKILTAFQTRRIIPTKDSYTTAEDAYWAASNNISTVFNNTILRDLIHKPNASWIFPSASREKYQEYIEIILPEESINYEEEDTVVHCIDEDVLIERITPSFIQNRDIKWLK